ncbi:hypothetical protein HDU86_004006 [Geranomyces michiganensis]|nr:hypothetical protein HDU86_004006 [Geranomyces michiganensis]
MAADSMIARTREVTTTRDAILSLKKRTECEHQLAKFHEAHAGMVVRYQTVDAAGERPVNDGDAAQFAKDRKVFEVSMKIAQTPEVLVWYEEMTPVARSAHANDLKRRIARMGGLAMLMEWAIADDQLLSSSCGTPAIIVDRERDLATIIDPSTFAILARLPELESLTGVLTSMRARGDIVVPPESLWSNFPWGASAQHDRAKPIPAGLILQLLYAFKIDESSRGTSRVEATTKAMLCQVIGANLSIPRKHSKFN